MALSHAILASLLEEPKTGYDLAKQFGTKGYFWRASHQQIYRELTRLEGINAIATATDEPGARGDRKRMITDVGREHLAEWVRLPSESATIKEDVLVKCLTIGLVDSAVIVDQLQQNRAEHLARRSHYLTTLESQFPGGAPSDGPTLGRYLALRAGAIYEAAWVEWADIAIQAISGGDSR